jgi:FAD/FMN-containing dehydrogenase
MNARPTLATIAAALGVSRMTVSNAFNRPDQLSPELRERVLAKAAELGYGEYRAHIDFMDLCAQAYDFNDHAGLRLAETIKDALDPNGILMPGKQGIWPKGLRAR